MTYPLAAPGLAEWATTGGKIAFAPLVMLRLSSAKVLPARRSCLICCRLVGKELKIYWLDKYEENQCHSKIPSGILQHLIIIMKLMFLSENRTQEFLEFREKMQVNPKHMHQSMWWTSILYRKLIHHFNDIQLVTKNPDLIILDDDDLMRQYNPLVSSTYTHVRKIYKCDENIYARGYYYDRTRFALLKLSEALRLKKNTLSKLEQLRLLVRRRRNKYPVRESTILKFLEKTSSNTFSILTNDITETGVEQRKNLFCYPHFLNCNVSRIIAAHEKIDERERGFACYIQRLHTPERKVFLDILSRYKKIDCFGDAGYNEPSLHIMQDLSPPLKNRYGTFHHKHENYKIYQHYKFAIVFENSIATDYITEKIVLAMLGNTIPIYWGTSSVNKYFNPGSFIHYDNYESFTEMAEAVIALDQDEQRYWDMHRQPFFPNNQLPAIITDIRRNLDKFLDRALDL